MSEVHRYQVVKMLTDVGNCIRYDPHGPDVVMAADFDRVTAELKEGITKHWHIVCDQRAKIDALQTLLTAADERADVLERLLRLARQFVTNGVELGYITMPDPETPDAAHDLVPMIDAALKPAEPAKCNACGGRGSVCVDWDSGAWADCQECTKS